MYDTMPSCDADTDAGGIMWHQHQWMPMASHDKVMSHLISIVYLINVIMPMMIPSASQYTNTSANGITWPRCTSFQSSWHKECNGAIHNSTVIKWCQQWCQYELTDATVSLTMSSASHAANSSIKCHQRTKRWCGTSFQLLCQSTWCHWSCHCHHMMLMPVALPWPNKSCCISYQSSLITNAIVPLITLLALCDTDPSIKWSKRLCCTLLQSSWFNECSEATDNAIGKRTCFCQFQQWQMLHLILVILN